MDDQQLLERARSDPAAFAAFYCAHYSRVYTYAYRRCGRRADAEDIAAATFESVLRSLPRYRPGPEPAAAWLYRIAARRVADHFRHGAQVPVGPVAPAQGTTDPPDVIDTLLVRQALARLRPPDRTIIDMVYFMDLSRSDIAATLGCTADNASLRLHRALKRLAQVLAELGVQSDETSS